MNQLQKAQEFHNLHTSSGCFLMPNAWDIGSAKMLASAGFKAIGTTSAGIAFSLGRPDNAFCSKDARLNREEMFNQIIPMLNSVSIPVNADLEDGFGSSPETVYETIKMAIESGAVGGNIEDYTGDSSQPLFDLQLSIDRIKAAKKAIDESEIPFVLVARTDALNIGLNNNLREAIDRANHFREAGADCLFSPGASDKKSISELVKEIHGPINVVMGLTSSDLSVSQLSDLGVRRVSIGGSLARAMYYQIQQATKEMYEKGTFSYATNQVSQHELNSIFEQKL